MHLFEEIPTVTPDESSKAKGMITLVCPYNAMPADVMNILGYIGKCVVGGYAISSAVKEWLLQVPPGVLLFAHTALLIIGANSPAIVEDQMVWTIYGLTGYRWLYEMPKNT